MSKYFTLLVLIFSVCFPGFKIGIDALSELDFYDFGSSDLDIGFLLGYENIKSDSDFGFGIEYLFPTEIKNTDDKVSMVSLYGMSKFYNSEDNAILGKIGYSIPKIDWEDESDAAVLEVDGGLMYGIQFNFNKVQLSCTIHKWDINYNGAFYSESMGLNLKRLVLYFSFN